jgi:uncharacterized OB-fold protein
MTNSDKVSRVVPYPSLDDAPFWEGCKDHRLLLQRCPECGEVRFWNRPMCANCQALASDIFAASGRGTIWSFTTTHHAFNRAWRELVPYTVVVVELDEGPRMTSNLLASESEIAIGRHVEIVFDDVTTEVTLPLFRLADV